MCSLAAELIVKAGALGFGAQGGGKTTTAAAAGTTRRTQYVSRGATKCVYACVVGARYIYIVKHTVPARLITLLSLQGARAHTRTVRQYIDTCNTIAAVIFSVDNER